MAMRVCCLYVSRTSTDTDVMKRELGWTEGFFYHGLERRYCVLVVLGLLTRSSLDKFTLSTRRVLDLSLFFFFDFFFFTHFYYLLLFTVCPVSMVNVSLRGVVSTRKCSLHQQ